MTTHPFTFGVQIGGRHTAESFATQVRHIEDLGYATLYAPDHFVDTELAPLVVMAMAAAVTSTLRVAALVFGNDYKHPAVLAKEVATIDALSGGRAVLGLGAGWMIADYEALGIPYDKASVRIARLAEALAIVKGAWAPGPFSHAGTHYTINHYDGTPTPVQTPYPRILVGGGGRKVLTLAGREADIVGINPNLSAGALSPSMAQDAVAEQTARKIEWVREGAGDRFDDIELQIRYFLAAVTDDRRGLAETLAPAVGLAPEVALESGIALVGTVDEICDQLGERRERWGVSNVVIGGDQIDAFAPVVARLAGS